MPPFSLRAIENRRKEQETDAWRVVAENKGSILFPETVLRAFCVALKPFTGMAGRRRWHESGVCILIGGHAGDPFIDFGAEDRVAAEFEGRVLSLRFSERPPANGRYAEWVRRYESMGNWRGSPFSLLQRISSVVELALGAVFI